MSSAENYKKVVTSKLSFKGAKPLPSSLGKRKIEKPTEDPERKEQKVSENSDEEIVVMNGSGRITSSGTTVHGHGTDFMSQLSVNDAIIITHPATLLEETKVVRMVLSNISISISSAFSTDLISTTPFKFIKAPKDREDLDEKQRKEEEKKFKEEENAFGTYASKNGTQFTYRVKKDGAFGGYKIVTESTSSSLSREELLDKRTKKKSDRYCY